MLLIMALCISYYLQIKRIRAVHETVISIFAGMIVGIVVRLSPGHVIRDMMVCDEPVLWTFATNSCDSPSSTRYSSTCSYPRSFSIRVTS